MISRIWHGWTKAKDADAYERMLREDVFPGIERIRGSRGAFVLRRDVEGEVEFVTMCLFDDMDAVRRFAGADYTLAVIHEPARPLLIRFDDRSAHYDTVLSPAGLQLSG